MNDEMSERDRLRLAVAVIAERRRRGSKKAAYTFADLNSATWDKAEKGEYIRPHIVGKMVSNLWPESEGDWTRVPGLPEDAVQLSDSVVPRTAIKPTGLDGLLRSMSKRIADLEVRVDQLEGGGDSGTQTSTQKNDLEVRRTQNEEVSDATENLSSDPPPHQFMPTEEPAADSEPSPVHDETR